MGLISRSFAHLISALWLSVMAMVVGGFFAFGRMLPLEWSVVFLGGLAAWGLLTQSLTRLSLLPRLMILLYSVCFMVTIGHLFDPYYVWWHTPAAIALIRNQSVSESMMTVGIVGLLGLLTGFQLTRVFPTRTGGPPSRHVQTLGRLAFVTGCLLAVLLSWVVAPASTIFVKAYNSGGSAIVAAPMNFNAAGLLSYVLVVLLVIDAERDQLTRRRRFKNVAITRRRPSSLSCRRSCVVIASSGLSRLWLLYLTGGQSGTHPTAAVV